MNTGNRLGVAPRFRNLYHSERCQDRPLDLSLGSLSGPQCQPIDLRRRRSVIRVDAVPRVNDVRKTWHHVRLNRRNEPLPYFGTKKSEHRHSFKPKSILQKESVAEAESNIASSTPTASSAGGSKGQKNLFGGTTYTTKTEKVSTSNTTFTSTLGNPFKKIGDGSPEPANKSLLAPSKIGSFSNTNSGSKFGFKSSSSKPSSFSSMCAKPQTDGFKLKPSVLFNSLSINPFKKSKYSDESDADSTSADKPKQDEEQKENRETTEAPPSPKDNDQPSLFVPLSNQSESIKSSDDSLKSNGVSTSNTQTGFIFGQNLQPKNSDENRVGGFFATDSQGGDGKSENLFCKAVSVLPTDHIPQEDWTVGKSLVETSRELTEREQNLKRKYDEVEIVTGEEEESNVIQMLCKLYSWTSGSWQERGRGILRLNDKAVNSELFSRLVIRTQGTLTIMLNTKIWADMSVEKVNDKSVRFTACDADGQPKIFLVMGTPKDVEILHTSLDYRIFETKQQKKTKSSEEEKT